MKEDCRQKKSPADRPHFGERNRFTLVELLIVIAIIAILAGMLLPALAKARQKALLMSCVSNLKPQGQTLALYINDNADMIVPAKTAGLGGIGTSSWQANYAWLLGKTYTPGKKSNAVFQCPALNENIFTRPDWWYQKGYALNSTNFADENREMFGLAKKIDGSGAVKHSIPRHLAEIPAPSSVIAACEIDPNAWFYYNSGSVNNVPNTHDGPANVLFLDGHVSTLTMSAFRWGLCSDSNKDRPVYYKYRGGMR